MRRSVLLRLTAFVLALLGSLSAPALALAHGLAHAHLAHDHKQGVPTGLSTPTLDAPVSDHAHEHATVDVAPAARDVGRLDLTPATLPASPAPALILAELVVVRSPALTDRALLARPDPGDGTPPRLRAPPAV